MTSTTISISPQTAQRINKGLALLAVSAFAIAAVTLFPSFGPSTAANASPIAAKSDRLTVADANPSCAAQNWPYLSSSCLRNASNPTVKIRNVTTDRL